MDPLSDKYPHLSNYVYCSNNPIRFIDPNGKDEYEFDQCGYLKNIVYNNEKDIMHVVDENGIRIISSNSYDYETISSITDNISVQSGQIGNAMIFEIASEKDAVDMFLFLSINTSVEWGVISADNPNGGCQHFIGTNHDAGQNNIRSIITQNGFFPDMSIHNHPNNNNSVSIGDHYDAIISESLNRNVHLYNYTRSNGFTLYNSHSPYVDRDGDSHILAPLPTVTISPNK